MAPLASLQPLLSTLAADVAQRDPEVAGDRPGLTAVIDVVTVLGRELHRPDHAALHEVLPYLARLREALENEGGIEQSPWEALRHDKAESFAAGSLWAISAIADQILEAEEEERRAAGERSGRAAIRDLVLRLAEKQEAVAVSDVLNACQPRHKSVAQSTVSKAIGDLLRDGKLKPADAPDGADRRHRWYRRV